MIYIQESPRWLVFSLISSILCISGALCVPLMSAMFKSNTQSSSSNNTKLVNYGLSLSAGSMLTTSLYMMLPKMNKKNKSGVFLGVLTGVCISLILNYIVHVYASESLVHCAHGDEHDEGHTHGEMHSGVHGHDHHHHDHHHGHSSKHEHEHSTANKNGNNGNNPTHQVNVNYEIQYRENYANEEGNSNDTNSYTESDPLLPNTNNGVKESSRNKNMNSNNKNVTVTLSKKKSITVGKSLIDLFTKNSRKSIGDCCSLGECTPTLETNDLPCSKIAMMSSNNIIPTISNRSDNNNCNSNNLEHVSSNNLDSIMKNQQGIACVENVIGYDLENLSLYRKNFYSANSDKEESNISYHNHTTHSNSSAGDQCGSSSESFSSVHDSNSIDSHEELNDHQHNHSSISNGPNNFNKFDLENHISHIESYPYSGYVIRHHSLQTSHIHHHHIETPFSKLLSIGMQTCIVLTLHKFPEGFIIFYTNKDDTPDSLGFSIFLSLTIHNFVEGFAMTLPLYAIFETKWLAVLITAILGGGSQPMGALLGYLIFGRKPNTNENALQMDFFLSVTAGFLLFIGLQMFQTGVGFSDAHHHHHGEGNEEMKRNHSSGTTCLKWCCAGVLLIIASQVFE